MNTNLLRGFTSIDCYKCGVIFFLPTQLDTNNRANKSSFFCPNGHSQAYVKSTADALQEKLSRTESWLENERTEKCRLERELTKVQKKLKTKKK